MQAIYPVQSKTQHQVSRGTHVVVLILMGLEEPTTACGVPLCFMAKSNPSSVLEKLQESLHRGNYTPAGFFSKDLPAKHPSPRHWTTPLRRGFCVCVAFSAHPHYSKCFHTVLNLQENQRIVADHRTQPYGILFY